MKRKKKRRLQVGEDEPFTSINEYELDKEWVGQPDLAKEYGEKLAKAQRNLDEWQNNLELVKAEEAKNIRDDPEAYELSRATQEAVKDTIPLQPSYQNALEKVAEAKYIVGMVKAATVAVEHRKKALEKLVDLHLAGYFGAPRGSSEARQYGEESNKKAVRSKPVKRR